MLFQSKAVWLRKMIAIAATLSSVSASCKLANSQPSVSPTPTPMMQPPLELIVQIDAAGRAYINGKPTRMLFVQLDANSRTYINGKPVAHDNQKPTSEDQLTRALIDFNRAHPCDFVVLFVSRSTIYNSTIEMLDLFRRVGVGRIAINSDYLENRAITPVSGVFGLTELPVSYQVTGDRLADLRPQFSNCPR
jgi:biopolymer transport protein ExbD